MYVQPNTNIRILHNIPLDNSYDHTIYFVDATAQRGYFAYYTKYDLNNYTYQRVERGKARVGINAENLYDCNYMMFQNTAFGSKWFYAFINNVEYINNDCSEITFELDELQTWHFDYHPDYCFVEREHSTTDGIGDNILPEPVALGEYKFNGSHPLIDLSNLSVIIAVVNVNDQTGATQGNKYDGIYGGAELYAFNVSSAVSATSINTFLEQFIQKPDAIVAMYMCPTAFITNVDAGTHKILQTDTPFRVNISDSPLSSGWTLDGYLPKNKKLFTYPYNFYMVDNGQGSSINLPYEFFANLTPTFRITGMITQPVKAVIRPTAYKNANTCMTENVGLTNFPMCSWSFDAYSAWVAQNSIPLLINNAGSLIGGAIKNPMPTSIIGNAVQDVASVISQAYTASIQADFTRGSQDNGGINAADGKQQFYGSRMSVTYQYAAMIDDFFSRFGYATNRLKIPNRLARPHWSYVKTRGCTLTGSVPADSMKKICSLYDAGITWWKYGSEVGNYTLNNAPV